MIYTQTIIKTVALSLISLMLLNACQQENPKQEKTQNINDLEKKLFETKKGVIDRKEAANMIHTYIQYVDAFPSDSMSAKYLFKAADVSLNSFHSQQSIDLFNRILKEYPDYSKTPQALFLKAFTFENYLQNLDSAKKNYQLFLERYPNNAFANDAQLSLQNLGKSPEEIIQEFNNN